VTVWVDDMMMRADVPNGSRVVRGRWCHMMATTTEELDAMALAIGMRTAWRQHTGRPTEHYDVTMSKRALAVKAGAVEITWGEGAAITWHKVFVRETLASLVTEHPRP
jgi:hypothetical protein